MGLRRDALIKMAKGWSGRMAAIARPSPKKRIDIEALLRWTYLTELPKRPPQGPKGIIGAWEKVDEWLEELSVAGLCQNGYGVVCDFSATSWPHDDAYVVHEAVGALDALELGMPDDWSPIEDLGDLGALGQAAVARAIAALTVRDATGARRLRQKPRRLIFRHAILGGAPDWRVEAPERKFELGANGKTRWLRRVWVTIDGAFGPIRVEREVDGFDQRAKRPYDDAYPREILDPDPVDSIISRAEYEIWRSALGFLVDELAGSLSAHEPVMTARPEQPWSDGAPRKSFIWPDLSVRAAPAPSGAPRRRVLVDVASARRALEKGA